MSDQFSWKNCSSCRKPIEFSKVFWVCSVSTCRGQKKGLPFCTVSCWDSHLSLLNHREAWAEEKQSPSKKQFSRGEADPFVGLNKNKLKIDESYKHVSSFSKSKKSVVVRKSKKS